MLMIKIIDSVLLILLLLVSNLILVYRFIVASRSYVDKLALLDQSSVFKLLTVLALIILLLPQYKHKIVYQSQYLQYCPSTTYYRTLFSFPSILFQYDHTIVHGPQFLRYYPSMITNLYTDLSSSNTNLVLSYDHIVIM